MRKLAPLLSLIGVAAVAGVSVVVVASRTGGSDAPPQTPEAFMTRVLKLTVDGDYAEAWSVLHPGHQQIAPRGRFVGCRSADASIAGYRFVSARFVEKRLVRIESPGVPQRTATQVVLRFRIADGEGKTLPPEDATVRAVWIDTRWAWVLPDREIPTFRSGRCPV